MKHTIAVDVDGVLAQYTKWYGCDYIGPPIPGAQGFMASLMERYDVILHTVRVSDVNRDQKAVALHTLRQWLAKNKIPYTAIWTGMGKPLASAYVDDRAVVCRPMSAGSPNEVYAEALTSVHMLVPLAK